MKKPKRTYYILHQEKTGAFATWTLATNRTDSWALMSMGTRDKNTWLADGWKCVPVKLLTQ